MRAAVIVGVAQRDPDLLHAELVLAGPRLVSAQAVDPREHRRAVLVAALVGVDLGEVDLGQLVELAGDLPAVSWS